MKILTTGLCVLGFAFLTGSAQAQCGCGTSSYVPRTYTTRVVPMTYPATIAAMPTTMYSASPASGISYVNKLAAPLDRGSYVLHYAVHLNNGQVLYTEYLPQGYAVAGTEAGRNGRRVSADIGNDGMVNVNDPGTRQIIAVIPR
ncbi:MAG: hypothetical protein NTY15_20345 [Planctomycetota bacterium]|nr:hypothetical protein [Planctomycetota bacterium]